MERCLAEPHGRKAKGGNEKNMATIFYNCSTNINKNVGENSRCECGIQELKHSPTYSAHISPSDTFLISF